MNELTLASVQSQLTGHQKLMVDEGTIKEINKLVHDPDYGPEFLESYLDCLNVLAEAPRNNHSQYLNAMKFFSLVEAGNSLTDAYVKTFPDRFNRRAEGNPGKSPDQVAQMLRGEASRYNGSKLMAEIRRVATIPIQLVHRHLLNEAILKLADLMANAKSEMVQSKAADSLIRELKPAEDQVLNVKVEDGSISVIAELQAAAQALAAAKYERVMAGVPLKEIAQSKIYTVADDIEDA